MIKMSVPIAVVASCLLLAAGVTVADDDRFHHRNCKDVPGHAELTAALKSVVGFDNAGLGHDMWATVVDKDGFVCAVTFSGMDRQAQVVPVHEEPGVIAKVTALLAERGISLNSVLQREAPPGTDDVPVVITTHEAREGDVRTAVAEIDALRETRSPCVHLRIVDEHPETITTS